MAYDPIIHTSSGSLRGKCLEGSIAFLGVPYAAAPFGAHRMMPPQPVDPWSDVREAVKFGPTVPKGAYAPHFQSLFPEVTVEGDECLNLNIWTPDTAARGLPVFLWIHGGAFTNGSNSVAEYDGLEFARDGVVCVTINYRLAAEGFLYTEEGPSNLGLLDQIAALHWVQENIASFGGDPDRVTVGGESAGAYSATCLMSLPQCEGLFSQAIVQSGFAFDIPTADTGLLVTRYLAEQMGVEPTRDALMNVPLQQLVDASAALLTDVQTGGDPEKWGEIALTMTPFTPIIDSSVLTAQPLDLIEAGQGKNIRLLAGSNRDEARLFFTAEDLSEVDDETLAAASYGLDAKDVDVYRRNRPSSSPGDILAAIITDWYFRIPMVRLAEARDASQASSTWLYQFEYPDPDQSPGFGSCHGAELPYVFKTTDDPSCHARIGDQPSAKVADLMHRLWVEFIITGNPGWRPYSREERNTGLLRENVTEVGDPQGIERRLWNNACRFKEPAAVTRDRRHS